MCAAIQESSMLNESVCGVCCCAKKIARWKSMVLSLCQRSFRLKFVAVEVLVPRGGSVSNTLGIRLLRLVSQTLLSCYYLLLAYHQAAASLIFSIHRIDRLEVRHLVTLHQQQSIIPTCPLQLPPTKCLHCTSCAAFCDA